MFIVKSHGRSRELLEPLDDGVSMLAVRSAEVGVQIGRGRLQKRSVEFGFGILGFRSRTRLSYFMSPGNIVLSMESRNNLPKEGTP